MQSRHNGKSKKTKRMFKLLYEKNAALYKLVFIFIPKKSFSPRKNIRYSSSAVKKREHRTAGVYRPSIITSIHPLFLSIAPYNKVYCRQIFSNVFKIISNKLHFSVTFDRGMFLMNVFRFLT